ncbi:MAG: TonB-dependent receptor, partial [Pseudomonadota bacterium]
MSTRVSFKNLLSVGAAPVAVQAALAGFGFAMAPAGAHAQTDEIIVQATRRETSLQETPVAVTALDDNTIETVNPRDLGDIAQLVPNFSAAKITGFNAASFAIRGAAQTDIIVYSEPQVGVTLDDFVVPHVQTQLLDLFDVEQVEVLRGPQGTLFGKNTTAGVVNLRTKQPILNETSAEARFQFGSFDRFEARGAINIPVGENAALRVATLYQKSDGFYRNGAAFGPVPGSDATGQGDNRRLGGEDVISARAKLRWEPTDTFDATLQYELIRDNSDTVPSVNETPTDPGAGFAFTGLGFTEDPGDPLDNAGITSEAATGVDINLLDGHQVDVNGYYLNMNWELAENVTLKSITGFRDQASQLPSNYVGEVGPISLFDANRADERETFQQEIRLNWQATDQLDFVFGGFYQENDT